MSARKKCINCKYYAQYHEIIDGEPILMNFGFCTNAINEVRRLRIYTIDEKCRYWSSAANNMEMFFKRLEEALKKEELRSSKKPSK